jgi:hypothetical protein
MPLARGRLAGLGVLTAMVVVLVSACGGGGSSSSDTVSAVDWANNVCSAVTSWTSSIQKTGDELRSGSASKATLQSAAGEFQSSTQKLADDLKGLGKPDVDAGEKAQAAVDKLANQVQQDSKTIKSSVQNASGVAGLQKALATVSTTLTQMGSEISSAFQQLGTIDAKGKLQDAFKKADKCSTLVNSSG